MIGLNYVQKFIAGEIYMIAPLPLKSDNYPFGFKIQLSSEHGKTKHMNVSPEQLKKIEQILLGAV